MSQHHEAREALQGAKIEKLIHHLDLANGIDELEFHLDSGRTVLVAANPTEPSRLDLRFISGP